MRKKALQAWNIEWAFLSLPLLLLVALVLFFVGLVDFLLSLNKKVAAPVAVLVYITLAILFLTTVLPSLQIFMLSFFTPDIKQDADVPTPCPYKSPQSWLFHRSLILMNSGFRHIMRKFSRREEETEQILSRADMPMYFIFYSSPIKWTHHDTKWLRLRDVFSQDIEGNYKQTDSAGRLNTASIQNSRRPTYDEAQILKQTIGANNPSPNVLFAAYRCFGGISKNALYQGIDSHEDYLPPKSEERNLILRGYYWKHIALPISPEKSRPRFGPPVSELIENPRTGLLHDENALVFLQMHTPHNLPEDASLVISAHLSELQGRILAYIYGRSLKLLIQPPTEDTAIGKGKSSWRSQWLTMLLRQYNDMINSTNDVPKFRVWSQFAPKSLVGNHIPVSANTVNNAIIQYSMIFEKFISLVAESEYLEWKKTIHAHRSISQFLNVSATMLRYKGMDQTPFDSFSRFEKSFTIIQTALGSSYHLTALSENVQSINEYSIDQSNADYLFLSACLLVDQLFDPYAELPLTSFTEAQCDRMADFIKALHAYEQEIYPFDRIQDNWKEFWRDTGLPQEPRFECRLNSTRRSYIRWKDIPEWVKIDFPTPQTA